MGDSPPDELEPWRMVEGLSLLSILLRADGVLTPVVTKLFGKTGPINVTEDGRDHYIWAQHDIRGRMTDLYGRPDIIVTDSPDIPSPSNVVRIVECKSGRHIGAAMIRSEFGKSHDLGIESYLIWSFFSPKENVIRAAASLGLDLTPLGFDTDRRNDLISKPECLLAHVANTIAVSRKSQNFANAIANAGEESRKKWLRL